jgi:hypothetical protein
MLLLHFANEDASLMETVEAHLRRAGLGALLQTHRVASRGELGTALPAADVLIVPWPGGGDAAPAHRLLAEQAQRLVIALRYQPAIAPPQGVLSVDMSDWSAGLVRLSELLARELLLSAGRPAALLGGATPCLRDATWNEVRQVARRCLDSELLADFLDWTELGPLPTGTLEAQREALLHLLQTPEERERFADFLEQERPECTQRALQKVRQRGTWRRPDALAPAPSLLTELKVFISFASEDRKYRDELQLHLHALGRVRPLRVLHRDALDGGEPLARVASWLDAAQVIMPLLSAPYLASHDQYAELLWALRRRSQGDALVLPVLLRPVLSEPIIGQLLVLPRGGPPVEAWKSRDAAWNQVTKELLGWGRPAAAA